MFGELDLEKIGGRGISGASTVPQRVQVKCVGSARQIWESTVKSVGPALWASLAHLPLLSAITSDSFASDGGTSRQYAHGAS
jgi:hypothetical protein